MVSFLKDSENERINKMKYVFPEIVKIKSEKLTIGEMYWAWRHCVSTKNLN